jgi:putative aldouronate transport system permease protein
MAIQQSKSWSAPYLQHRWKLLMLACPFAFLIVFSFVPMAGVLIAFKEFRMTEGILGSPWNGLDNFRRLFTGGDFTAALRNTLTISILRLGFGFLAPVVLALLLNEVRSNLYKRGVQTLTYMPHFISWVILGGIFLMLFSINGPVNTMLRSMGLDSIPFLTSDGWFLFLLISSAIWHGVGYGSVIYLAALSGIDPQLYEAAVVDGAGRWKQTLHITLPCLVPTMITLFILALGGILNAGFDQIFNLYNVSVYDVSDILDTYVLRRLMSLDYGLATAAGLFKSLVGMFLVIGANALARFISQGEQGVW